MNGRASPGFLKILRKSLGRRTSTECLSARVGASAPFQQGGHFFHVARVFRDELQLLLAGRIGDVMLAWK
jgi:hypothetical protein